MICMYTCGVQESLVTGRMRPGLLYDESEEEEEEMGVPLPRRRRTDQPEEGMEFEEVSLYHTHHHLYGFLCADGSYLHYYTHVMIAVHTYYVFRSFCVDIFYTFPILCHTILC